MHHLKTILKDPIEELILAAASIDGIDDDFNFEGGRSLINVQKFYPYRQAFSLLGIHYRLPKARVTQSAES
jgi:hypothetical protein